MWREADKPQGHANVKDAAGTCGHGTHWGSCGQAYVYYCTYCGGAGGNTTPCSHGFTAEHVLACNHGLTNEHD